jgi:hypothetical protein
MLSAYDEAVNTGGRLPNAKAMPEQGSCVVRRQGFEPRTR